MSENFDPTIGVRAASTSNPFEGENARYFCMLMDFTSGESQNPEAKKSHYAAAKFLVLAGQGDAQVGEIKTIVWTFNARAKTPDKPLQLLVSCAEALKKSVHLGFGAKAPQAFLDATAFALMSEKLCGGFLDLFVKKGSEKDEGGFWANFTYQPVLTPLEALRENKENLKVLAIDALVKNSQKYCPFSTHPKVLAPEKPKPAAEIDVPF